MGFREAALHGALFSLSLLHSSFGVGGESRLPSSRVHFLHHDPRLAPGSEQHGRLIHTYPPIHSGYWTNASDTRSGWVAAIETGCFRWGASPCTGGVRESRAWATQPVTPYPTPTPPNPTSSHPTPPHPNPLQPYPTPAQPQPQPHLTQAAARGVSDRKMLDTHYASEGACGRKEGRLLSGTSVSPKLVTPTQAQAQPKP